MVSNEIIQVIDALEQKLGIAIDWTSENVLPYLQELAVKFIHYDIAMNILSIITGLILGIGGTKAAIWGFKISIKADKEWKVSNDTSGIMVGGMVIGITAIILGVSGIIWFIVAIPNLIADIFFPEKAIFDYIMYLKNNM